MNTLIRFLSFEAIENCATCLNYKIDSVIFFGYQQIIDRKRKGIQNFLNNVCNTECVFIPVDEKTLSELHDMINDLIKDDHYYFDLTGCEGSCEVAFINIAYQKNIPMHIYDVHKRKAYYVDDEINGTINDVEKREIRIRISDYIKMYGGSIRFDKNTRHKNFMNENTFRNLAQIIKKNGSQWSYYVSLFQRMQRDKLLTYTKNLSEQINQIGYPIKRGQLYEMLEELESVGLIEDLRQNVEQVSFSFANNSVRHYLTDNGAVLEEIVYREEKKNADDCMMSVNLDWDGIAEETTERDVVNEIDVLSLNGYELTFISCKNTVRIRKEDLYELETITRKFGGKYARMKLATTADINLIEMERAKSMGVEIIKFNP